MTLKTQNSRALSGIAIGALVALLMASCKPAASTPKAAADPDAPTAASFVNTPGVSATVEAAPRLVGESSAIRAINADLDAIDAASRENAAACEGGGYSRTITQPMTGPGYVSYWISDDYECGGPYPSTGQIAVTYDLATGRRVDWTKAMPAWGLSADSLEDMPAGSVAILHSAAMADWYSRKMLASTDQEWLADCREVFTPEALNGGGFKVWADAGNAGVSVAPELPHVVQACGEQASLSADDMRAAGVVPAMIEALAKAGEDRNWLPYQEGV